MKLLAASNATTPSIVIVRGFGEPLHEVADALVGNLRLVEETIESMGDAVFSIAPDRPTRVQLLPLGQLEQPAR